MSRRGRVPYLQGRPLYDETLEPPMPLVSRFRRTDRPDSLPGAHADAQTHHHASTRSTPPAVVDAVGGSLPSPSGENA